MFLKLASVVSVALLSSACLPAMIECPSVVAPYYARLDVERSPDFATWPQPIQDSYHAETEAMERNIEAEGCFSWW